MEMVVITADITILEMHLNANLGDGARADDPEIQRVVRSLQYLRGVRAQAVTDLSSICGDCDTCQAALFVTRNSDARVSFLCARAAMFNKYEQARRAAAVVRSMPTKRVEMAGER